MKIEDIPLEKNSLLNGQQKVMYAQNNLNSFERVPYASFMEEFATQNAVDEFITLQNEALSEIKAGISSPIKYFMYKNRMDLPTLCGHIGIFCFRVKRHLLMKHFLKLDESLLKRYADIFDITLDELKRFDERV